MPISKKSVAVYARVSTDRQTTDLQLAELREFTQRSGWTIHHEYIDHGYTGANTKRPAFNEMLAEARKKKFDCLFSLETGSVRPVLARPHYHLR